MSRAITLLDHRGNPIERPRPARQQVEGTYDASQYTYENAKAWSNVDLLSARAANSREVRLRLRTRARYMRSSNGYVDGLVRMLADDCVGTGAHLHMQTDDDVLNHRIEEEWDAWQTQVHLAIKLHTARQTLCTDGEFFGLLNTNPAIEGPVQLDVKLIEADQIQTPWLNPIDPLAVDGIRYDIYFNPIEYSMLRYHPGDYFQIGYIADPIDARAMLHWFNRERPGQCRGVPELTPSLDLIPIIKRYTLAVLGAAEAAADFAAVLYTELPPEVEDQQFMSGFQHMEIERRTMMTLPAGYKVGQIDPKQPTPSYKEFKEELLKEIGRPAGTPLNKITGDSSRYNYSSGRLDHQEYYKKILISQFHLKHWVLDPLFHTWLVELSLSSDILQGGPTNLREYKHNWFFDAQGHVDPEKEAKATEIELKTGMTTLAEEAAKDGKDWKSRLRQMARELAFKQELENEYGIKFPEQKPGGGGSFGGSDGEAAAEAIQEMRLSPNGTH